MSSESWKLEKDLCRCCHSEGSFKNLAEPAQSAGLSEIYADMLNECFDIDMAPVPGLLSAATYTICEICVIRLRDASEFKKQVLSCEERFKDLYNRNIIRASAPTALVDVEVKQEIPEAETEPHETFKVELSQDENDDEDYNDSMDLQLSEEEEEVKPTKVEATKKRKCKTKKAVKCKPAKKTKAKTKSVKVDPTLVDDENDAEKKQGSTLGSSTNSKDTYDVEEWAKQDYATITASYYTLENQEDGSKSYACTSCTKTYKTLPSVVQHYRYVHLRLRPKLRSCYYCEIKVPGHARAFHLEKEHGIPAPTCNACGKKFAYPFQVLRHQKNDHMGEKKFGCSECDLRFTSQANLTQHMIKHSGVRIHKCDICEKSFKWKKNLRTHTMMHLDERRHVCPVCKNAFVQQTSLKYHMTKRHPEYI